jgi:hypothetical protein
MVGHALLTQSDTDGPVTIAEKRGKLTAGSPFIGGRADMTSQTTTGYS